MGLFIVRFLQVRIRKLALFLILKGGAARSTLDPATHHMVGRSGKLNSNLARHTERNASQPGTLSSQCFQLTHLEHVDRQRAFRLGQFRHSAASAAYLLWFDHFLGLYVPESAGRSVKSWFKSDHLNVDMRFSGRLVESVGRTSAIRITMTISEKVARFEKALELFLERVRADSNLLAAVLVGSLTEETVWRRDAISLWLIEKDGVTKRLRADGENPRVFRTLVEEGVNLHVELIPRSRFKRMVEGSARTAFRYSFFARRKLVYCDDPSLGKWFEEADTIARRDQERELCMATTWLIHAHRYAGRLLEDKRDLDLAFQELLCCAHCVAAAEVITSGEVHEGLVVHSALELAPALMRGLYLDLLAAPRTAPRLGKFLAAFEAYLEKHAEERLQPVLRYLRKEKRLVSLSELADHFAHSQLYPWHLESACEWLERKGRLGKFSAPFGLTKMSRVEVEEPAYLCEEE
jgi:hypothetical protein